MYIPKYFKIQELVPPSVFRDRGIKAWQFLNPILLESLDQIREEFGPIIINNWHTGGNRQWSGLRTDQSPYGTAYSQHRFGNAADCLLKVDIDSVRRWVIDKQLTGITGVEKDVSWLHVDVRNCEKVMVF